MKTRNLYTLLLWLSLTSAAAAQVVPQEQGIVESEQQPGFKLLITVLDENNVPVISAQVILMQVETKSVLKGETDYAGRREFTALNAGLYQLQVEKTGFFAANSQNIQVGQTETVEVVLNHEQELRESLNVVYSPPAIDLTKTAASQDLSTQEIQNIPYSGTRDYRNVIAFIPGVIKGQDNQLHVNGAAASQNLNQLDGFNISHPADGQLALRVSPDAFRSIEVKTSRYSAEYGKGSGGIINLATRMGDDRTRFGITDFVPSFQFRNGFDVNSWTPRSTISGPLLKQRAWFFDAIDGEYNLDVLEDITDRSSSWRLHNLAKAQVNLNQSNILTGSFVINRYRSLYDGLSRLDPKDVTREVRQEASLASLKNQTYFSSGMLLELGIGLNQYRTREIPYGTMPFVDSPNGRSGNFFRSSDGESRRLQGIANVTLPPLQAQGRHELKFGMDVDRVNYDQIYDRRPMTFLRRNGTTSREITYINLPPIDINNTELSGYVQDRWSISDRLLVEGGLRVDWDQIIRDMLLSPRLATSILLTRDGETKLSLGAGIFYDPTNLNLITQPLTGLRSEQFYDSLTIGGIPRAVTRGDQLQTLFTVNQQALRAPRYLNWSLGFERKLPASVYLLLELIDRRGSGGLIFVNKDIPQAGLQGAQFDLSSDRLDRYDAVQVTLRREFKNNYTVFISYTRSKARSNAVFDVNLDNPVYGQQAGGPLSWDTPNHLISWGWLPLFWKFDLAYALDWRDGFPYSANDQFLQLVGLPNSNRFPRYFSLNLHAERRFRFLGYNWALRAGFNNITDSKNPSGVNTNIDSPTRLTFNGFQERTFVGRIRFLGRK